jgi:F-type H+-transporting ATPase subunit b
MLHLELSTIFFQVLNFLILLVLLTHFFYHPILRVMQRRQGEIAARLQAADERAHQADALRTELEEERARTRREAEALLAAARKQGAEVREQMLASAHDDAARMMADAQQAVEGEERRALERVQSRTRASALSVAASLIREAAGPAVHQQLLQRFFEQGVHVTGMAADGRGLAPAGASAGVTVDVAYPLSPAEESRLRETLEQDLKLAQVDKRVATRVDPSLLAGLRVSGDGFALDYSLRHTLEELQSSRTTEPEARQ